MDSNSATSPGVYESDVYFTLRATLTATRRLPRVTENNALNETQDCRLQILCRPDDRDLSEQPDRGCGPEWLRKVQHHRRGALGDGRNFGEAFARRIHGGRHFQRLRRPPDLASRNGRTWGRPLRRPHLPGRLAA